MAREDAAVLRAHAGNYEIHTVDPLIPGGHDPFIHSLNELRTIPHELSIPLLNHLTYNNYAELYPAVR